MEVDRWSCLFPEFTYEQTPPEEPSSSRRHSGRTLEAAARARSQDEVVMALDHETAHDEACRCLRCDIKAVNVS
jgi:hypothetical protein